MITDPFLPDIPVLENGIDVNNGEQMTDAVVSSTMVAKAVANFRKGSRAIMSRRKNKSDEDLEDNVTTIAQTQFSKECPSSPNGFESC